MNSCYKRVLADGQSVGAQVRQLGKAGRKKVFRELASGAKTDRAQLRRLLELEADDVLTVTRLDRLARSTRECCCCANKSWEAEDASSPLQRGDSDLCSGVGRTDAR